MNEALTEIWIRGYRSVRDLRLELGPVTVIQGANGVGKTNLYRAIQTLAMTTHSDFLESIARATPANGCQNPGKRVPGTGRKLL